MKRFNEIILCLCIAMILAACTKDSKPSSMVTAPSSGKVGINIRLDANTLDVKAVDIAPREYIPEKEILDFDPSSSDAIVFADPEIKRRCVNLWDTDSDGELSYAEASAVTDLTPLRTVGINVEDASITSFDELRFFTGIGVIPKRLFNKCTNLRSVRLPYNLTDLLYQCFGYTALEQISLPDSLSTLTGYLFYHSEQLKHIRFPRNVSAILNEAFDYINAKELILPYSITRLAGVFQGNNNLERVILPSGLTKMGATCFANCKNIKEVVFRSVVPPAIDYNNSTFYQYANGMDLYVPVSSLETYKTTNGWHRYTERFLPMIYQTNEEMAVNCFRIYVFDGQRLVAEEFFEGSEGTVEVPTGGSYEIYAIANLRRSLDITSPSDLSSIRIGYDESTSGSFVMTTDKVTVEPEEDMDLLLVPKRMMSKITIEGDVGFYRDFHRYPHESELLGAFIINIPSSADYDGNADTSEWINAVDVPYPFEGYVSPLTWKAADDPETIGQASFYCYPNDCAEAAEGGADMVTKLVIAARLDGELKYWTIGFPGIKRNTIYSIGNIRIHSEGSSVQNGYNPATRASIDITETDWSTGETHGTSLEITI